MTAEIAILNVEAVALAADSAVTVRDPEDESLEPKVKIFNSANKLLALSGRHPVGLMVYGSASVMGLPWETIVKEIRKELGDQELASLTDYSTALFTRLNEFARTWYPSDIQNQYLRSIVASAFVEVRSGILTEAKERLKTTPGLTESQLSRIGGGVVNRCLATWRDQPDLDTYTEHERRELIVEKSDEVEEVRKEILEEFPFSQTAQENLLRIGQLALTKFRPRDGENTGVVIAGFGRDDMMPRLDVFEIAGVALNRVRFVHDESRSGAINHETSARIVPFAQSQVVHAFLRGLDPEMYRELRSFRDRLFSQLPETVVGTLSLRGTQTRSKLESELSKALKAATSGLDEFLDHMSYEHFAMPVVGTIAHMPRDELASVAETLVNLTSFRQRVTMADETVGGPIDVAVISKGDGFIWIKRKHYFDAVLNQRFIARLYEGSPKTDVSEHE